MLALVLGVRANAGPDTPNKPPPPADDSKPEQIELTFAGDCMWGGWFWGVYAPKKAEPGDALSFGVEPLLKSDLAMVNLETPVLATLPKKPPDNKKMRFAATPDYVKALPDHGVTAVSVGNNHQLDMRAAGAAETMENVAKLGITAIGGLRADEPLIRVETIDVKGWKVGFIAASTWANNLPKKGEPKPVFVRPYSKMADLVVAAIDGAKADHDAVIVVLHWGVEYTDDPIKDETEAAHAFIDHGAIAVIGTHPHVLQGIERYKNGVIAYSLGNFVFRNITDPVRQAGVLRLAVKKDCLARVEFHPTIEVKKPLYHPEPADAKMFPIVAKRLQTLSAKLDTTWDVKDDRLTTPGSCP